MSPEKKKQLLPHELTMNRCKRYNVLYHLCLLAVCYIYISEMKKLELPKQSTLNNLLRPVKEKGAYDMSLV